MDNQGNMVQDLIRRARRRYVSHEALAQLALAASLAVAGLALLLVLGTAYLDCWSVLAIGVVGFGIGLWRVQQRIPTDYAMAVQLDANAGLHDSLSTAIHFSANDVAVQPFRELQRKQAEDAAQGVDLHRAIPFSTPRALYAMAALGLLATGLFALRYRMTGSLDLRPPLTQVLFEDQENPSLTRQRQNAPKKALRPNGVQSLLAKLGVSLNQEKGGKQDGQPDALDRAVEEAMKAPGATDSADKKGQSPGGMGKDGKAAGAGEQGAKGDPLDGGQPDKSGKEEADGKDSKGSQDGKSGDQQNTKNGNPGDNSSLLSKLKDAVSNMLSKAKPDTGGDKQKGGQQQGSDQAKSEKAGGGEKGKSGQSQQQGQQQASTQEADPNGDGQEGQQSQGKSGAKDSNQQASSQPGSGIGHQDGSKDMKAFEQLKAMGKLSEIIGRRATTVSGETSVEVESGSQQLRTGYTNSRAAHLQTDGEVNRDEVPPALQNYVQQYFQQVRKPAVTAKAAAGATKTVTP